MAIINGTAGDDYTLVSEADGDVIYGLEGNDTLTAAHNNVTLSGGSGDDELFSQFGTNNTTMDGGAGIDLLVGGGTNDTASYASAPAGVTVNLSAFEASADGYGASDSLSGIEDVTGSAFDDSLTGDDVANVLQGGAGNDTLTGNGDADVFKFSFDQEPGSGGGDTPLSFGEWLATEHALNIGTLRQNEFVQNYKEWLGYLAEDLRDNHGFNTVPDNAKVSFKQNDSGGTPNIEGLTQAQLDQIFGDTTAISVTTGKTSQVRYYSDIDTISDIWGGSSKDTLTSGDGFDKIVDFLWGTDKLEFNGLADLSLDQSQFASFFDVTQADVNGDQITDTVLALTDDSWGVTLIGVSGHTVDDFYNSINFS